ncbi:MAG TPA: PIG-L family deacetylase [Opitutus sp.]|nr:PIG-L family deacetylase [Opitutus sp.]
MVAAIAALTPVFAAESPAVTAIEHDLRSFRTLGTVLYVAAHPDDENTEFIGNMARGRGYRTAYLSMTRGDGGQNELGPDFGEKLGVLRTQELLAARRLDGGRQFFTRAIDFGFSKNPEETLRFWDHDRVLADVVRVFREFRPDVVVTRFPIPPGSGGHGHHTASAMLAVEAFKRAGDPQAFPDQLAEGLAPWQPKRIFWNVFSWGGRRNTQGLSGPTISVDIGGDDPVTGEAFGTIANQSRGMHKTQGLGGLASRTASGPNVQDFMLLAGDPAEHDIMDGVDTTWNRYPAGAAIGPLADELLARFDPKDPAASIPAILALRAKLEALPHDALLDAKRTQLDRILQHCLGLEVATTIAHADLVPGESFALHSTANVHSSFPVRWLGPRFAGSKPAAPADLARDQPATRDSSATLPIDTPLTQPYWLAEAPTTGLYTVGDPKLIGRPENPPAFPVDQVFAVGGQTLVIPTVPAAGEAQRPLEVVGPVSLRWSPALELLAPGAPRTVTLELTAARDGAAGTLQVEAPDGWRISPAGQKFHLGAAGSRTPFTFTVTAPPAAADAQISVRATIGPRRYHRDRTELRYSHLPVQLLQPDAQLHVVALDVAVGAKKVGYIPGAGDDIAACIRLLGCEVSELDPARLTEANLAGFDAIVLGVRAFNENKDLAAALPTLLAYVKNGGTLIAQYNRPNGLESQPLGPYPLSIQGPAPQLRVTDETAPVTFLAPDDPALNLPNKITAADFAGWVQERGAYFPSSWDESHYLALLAMSDPGEAPLKSSLLIAEHGRGHFVYTGLSFFRQLPAGTPGAYRLFANLLSLKPARL